MQYDFDKLKAAILFNTAEILPGDEKQLDTEILTLIEEANRSGQKIRHYIGFEISGQIHIGTGIASSQKIKLLQDAGVHCTIWLADYHTWLNNKLDGRIETARMIAREYFGPVMKKCLQIVGGSPDNLAVLHAADLYHNSQTNGQTFWDFDLNIGKELTLSRVLKSISVMGKNAGQDVEFGTLRYPVMQVADAFFLQTHLVHAGLDQRKCHVLMREVATKLRPNFRLTLGEIHVKPIAIHHNLLLGMEYKGGADKEAAKMSKSKPDSAVWVHDSEVEIARKLKKAYCPMPRAEQSIEEIKIEQSFNPILDWSKNMIFPAGQSISITRKSEHGGDVIYNDYQSIETDYFAGKLHPVDLKNGVATCLGHWFAPIRDFVDQNPDGLELVKSARKP